MIPADTTRIQRDELRTDVAFLLLLDGQRDQAALARLGDGRVACGPDEAPRILIDRQMEEAAAAQRRPHPGRS